MMTDAHIRVVPDDELRREAWRCGWKLNVIPGCFSYTLRGVAIGVARARTANGCNKEHIVAAEEDGTFTVLEITEAPDDQF